MINFKKLVCVLFAPSILLLSCGGGSYDPDNPPVQTFPITFNGLGVNFDTDSDIISADRDYTIGVSARNGYFLEETDFTIVVGNNTITQSASTWNWSNDTLTIKSKIITDEIQVTANADFITFDAAVTQQGGITIGTYDSEVSKKKDFSVSATINEDMALHTNVTIAGNPSGKYSLTKDDTNESSTYVLKIKDEDIVGNINVAFEKVSDDITISTTSISLLSYDNETISYEVPSGMDATKISSECSDSSLFTISHDVTTKKISIESNKINKSGTGKIKFKYDNEYLATEVSVSIVYPSNIDEAQKSFSLAAIKCNPNQEFSVTFNFDNTVDEDDFELSQEIYGRMGFTDFINYSTGVNKVNKFSVSTNSSYGNKVSAMEPGDQYFRYNPNNINYLNHTKSNTAHSLYIDSVNKTIDVANSEELFWAVEHGYRPNIASGKTKLIALYNTAKNICSTTVDPTMTEFEKLRILFEKLESITHYDYWVIEQKSYYWFYYSSYFLEGVFNDTNSDGVPDGYAVCDGFSKAYALLCGIEGLPCIRSYGFDADSGHAWNYIKLDGVWYLACPTWCKAGLKFDTNFIVNIMDYEAFGASKNYFKNLGTDFTDLAFVTYDKPTVPYCSSSILSLDKTTSGHSFLVSSDSDASAINTVIRSNISKLTLNHSYVCFAYKSTDYSKLDSWYSKIFSGLGNDFDCYSVASQTQPSTPYAIAWAYLIEK